MNQPGLKKNPFMSLWLSAANRMAGTLRGHATAQLKREVQAAVAVAEAAAALPLPVPKAKPRRRR